MTTIACTYFHGDPSKGCRLTSLSTEKEEEETGALFFTHFHVKLKTSELLGVLLTSLFHLEMQSHAPPHPNGTHPLIRLLWQTAVLEVGSNFIMACEREPFFPFPLPPAAPAFQMSFQSTSKSLHRGLRAENGCHCTQTYAVKELFLCSWSSV